MCSACTLMDGVTSKRGLGCEGPLEGWRGGGAPENGEAVIGGISWGWVGGISEGCEGGGGGGYRGRAGVLGDETVRWRGDGEGVRVCRAASSYS